MRLSRFVLVYPSVRPGEHLLYDVITDRYVGVDDAGLDSIASWRKGPPRGDDAAAQTALREQGFVVEDEAGDEQRLARYRDEVAGGIPDTLYLTLLPTLACNLACTYCFQKDHPAFERMPEETEAATVGWALRELERQGASKLRVHYFGGEPLTRKDLLLRTAERFRDALAARGGRFDWEITTNGIGLTVEFAQAMLAFGRGSVKVTLDGDAQTHDAARRFRGGQGSFDRILENLLAVARGCPELELRVGGNFRPSQRESYERLLTRLEAEGLAGRLERVRFKPVVDTAGDALGTCESCAGAEDETQLALALAQSVVRRGLARARERLTPSGPCELHWKRQFVIDPDGRLYKCPAVAGRPELAVGTVEHGEVRRAPLLQARPWEKCGSCPFLPVCMGGCLGGKYLQTGRMDEVFCRLPYFQLAYRREVVARYLDEFPQPFTAA